MAEININLGNCMEAMKSMKDNQYDLAIVDPEYGRKEHGGKKRSGYVKQKNGSLIYVNDGGYKKKDWDNNPAGIEYFSHLFRVSKNQIVWGVNYFDFPFGSGRIVWDKCNLGTDQSDCEIAFNSKTKRVDLFPFMWSGMMQGSRGNGRIMEGNKKLNEKRIHPTQKPVHLYKWLLTKYSSLGDKILDTHLGSGSIAIACHDLGYDLDGWELDKDYHAAATKRFNNHIKQLQLFQQ